jgi:hypothetical protein
MITRQIKLCALLLAALLPNPARAADWQHLHSWVGTNPLRLENGKRVDIWQDKSVRAVLDKLITKADIDTLHSYTNVVPVRLVDDHYLVIENCKPHDCPAEFSMIVLDTANQKLWIGFFLRESARVSTRWYGNADDYVNLPEPILRTFRENHGDWLGKKPTP